MSSFGLSEILPLFNPPDESLFFSRGESDDIRMGDIVRRKIEDPGDIDIVIIGVPQDEGVKRNKGRPGAKYAPDEIRKYLYRFTPFNFSLENQITKLKIFDLGNLKSEGTLEEIHEMLSHAVDVVLKSGMLPIVIGGGHDIAFPDYLGFAKNFENRALVNIDTHLDVRPNQPRNSGTPFRQILELDRLKPKKFFEIGIQNYANSILHFEYAKGKGAKVITLDEIKSKGIDSVIEYISNELKGFAVHLSFDVDSVRNSDAPGVSASYPDGLSVGDVLKIAFHFGIGVDVKIVDIAEVNPTYDVDGKTAKLSALFILTFLSGYVNRTI